MACTGASPSWNCDINSIGALVAGGSFVRGDTITVSGSGTVALTSTITLTKGVTITGPGRDILSITNSVKHFQITPDTTAITNEEPITISGLTLDGNNASTELINIDAAGPLSPKPFKSIIIKDNRFKNPQQTGSTIIYQKGHVQGVVARNLIERPNIQMRCLGSDNYAEYSNAAYMPVTAGGPSNWTWEDNTISWPTLGGSTAEGQFQGWIECGQGGRLTYRYNTVNFLNSNHQDEKVDFHGFQDGRTGTMIAEFYGNTYSNIVITGGVNNRFTFQRGGQVLVHNNHLTGVGGTLVSSVTNFDTLGWDDQTGVTDGEVNRSYYWNTTWNGTTLTPTWFTGGGYGLHLPNPENSKWWKENAACTASSCTAGVGKGTTTPTGTCTVGVGFWKASTATETVNPTVIQNGVFYKCTATNVWTASYTPAPYPHPLLSGSPPIDTPPGPPVTPLNFQVT